MMTNIEYYIANNSAPCTLIRRFAREIFSRSDFFETFAAVSLIDVTKEKKRGMTRLVVLEIKLMGDHSVSRNVRNFSRYGFKKWK